MSIELSLVQVRKNKTALAELEKNILEVSESVTKRLQCFAMDLNGKKTKIYQENWHKVWLLLVVFTGV